MPSSARNRVDLGIDPYEMGGLLIKADTHLVIFERTKSPCSYYEQACRMGIYFPAAAWYNVPSF